MSIANTLKLSTIALAMALSMTACGEEKKENTQVQPLADTQQQAESIKHVEHDKQSKNDKQAEHKKQIENDKQIKPQVEVVKKSDKKEDKQNDKTAKAQKSSCENNVIVNAYKHKQSDTQVKGCAVVIKVLPDDTKGHKHQKMIVKLTDVSPKRTVLIAHNIDLAPRVKDLTEGDEIRFYGEYEYNDRGGVVHWTHRDPAGRHQDGWIEKQGKRYQ